MSLDFRAIADTRRVKLGRDVEQFSPVATRRIAQIVQRIAKLKAAFTSSPAHICQRGIDSAFHRACVHPDLRKLLCRDLDVLDIGRVTNDNHAANCAFLVLPFGWV